jgi:hypothetical protein
MLSDEYQTIIFVDIPDPDNILMALQALLDSKGRVAIVLSPRIVDLSAARYGKKFAKIRRDVPFDTMALPIERGQQCPDVPTRWAKWFDPDGTLADEEIRKDTRLYVDVSAMRVTEVLRKFAPKDKEYTIFWDPHSLSEIKQPDMRHALHVHDFRFNFNKKETKQYKEVTKAHRRGGPALRTELRKICHRYIGRQREKMGLRSIDVTPIDIRDLFKANQKVEDARIVIGGPLTEALQYLKWTPDPGQITAMLGTRTRDRNTFRNVQFNLWKDLKSARDFLEIVAAKSLPMQIVPTECCKSKDDTDPCPYVLELSTYKELLSDSLVYRMIRRWGEDASQTQCYGAFDWVTAISAKEPQIFRWVPVKHEVCMEGEQISNITFADVQNGDLTSIQMAKADYEYMKETKHVLIREMKKVIPSKKT